MLLAGARKNRMWPFRQKNARCDTFFVDPFPPHPPIHSNHSGWPSNVTAQTTAHFRTVCITPNATKQTQHEMKILRKQYSRISSNKNDKSSHKNLLFTLGPAEWVVCVCGGRLESDMEFNEIATITRHCQRWIMIIIPFFCGGFSTEHGDEWMHSPRKEPFPSLLIHNYKYEAMKSLWSRREHGHRTLAPKKHAHPCVWRFECIVFF